MASNTRLWYPNGPGDGQLQVRVPAGMFADRSQLTQGRVYVYSVVRIAPGK
jgi:hypothetical protein